MKPLRRSALHALWLITAFSGCAYVPHAGDRLVLRRDAVAQPAPAVGEGRDADAPEPAEAFRGQPGLVLPTGATVEVIGAYDGKGNPTGDGVPAGAGNRWVRVKVMASPVAAQTGREGWVHVQTVDKNGDVRTGIEGLTSRTRQEATLCADTTAAQGTCATRIPAGTAVRPLTCAGGAVKVEYWDAQGLYASGFVPMMQLDGQPCASLAGAWGGMGYAMGGGAANYEVNIPFSPQFSHTPEELEAFVQKWTEGYQPSGAAIEGTLDGFQLVSLPVQRGQCYRMVLRLKPGAAFSDHARRGLEFLFHPENGGPKIHGGPGFHGPGGVGTIGCPQDSGAMRFDLHAYLGSAGDSSRVHELGQGGFVAQLYAKSVSEQELKEQQADTERQIQEAQEFKARQQDEACRVCRTRQLECLDGRHRPTFGNCTNEYRMCLQGRSVYNPNQCR